MIFDAIWLELEARHSKLTFPWEGQAARYRLAACVLNHANDLSLDVDQIKPEILQQLDEGKKPSMDRL